VAHPRAKLNRFGRELLVTRVLAKRWTVPTAAEAQGVSRATGYKWVRRFRAEGPARPERPQLAAAPLAATHPAGRGRADPPGPGRSPAT
jgi:transposase